MRDILFAMLGLHDLFGWPKVDHHYHAWPRFIGPPSRIPPLLTAQLATSWRRFRSTHGLLPLLQPPMVRLLPVRWLLRFAEQAGCFRPLGARVAGDCWLLLMPRRAAAHCYHWSKFEISAIPCRPLRSCAAQYMAHSFLAGSYMSTTIMDGAGINRQSRPYTPTATIFPLHFTAKFWNFPTSLRNMPPTRTHIYTCTYMIIRHFHDGAFSIIFVILWINYPPTHCLVYFAMLMMIISILYCKSQRNTHRRAANITFFFL